MPRSTKMRPEAAAEMARARVAAAAAAEAMREDTSSLSNTPLATNNDIGGVSNSGTDPGASSSSSVGLASCRLVCEKPDPAFGATASGNDASKDEVLDHGEISLQLDDATLLARTRGLCLDIPSSPMESPGFPRALSLESERDDRRVGGNSVGGSFGRGRSAAGRAVPEGFKVPEKKRVTFHSHNSVHNYVT
jgi:hypothetical protein